MSKSPIAPLHDMADLFLGREIRLERRLVAGLATAARAGICNPRVNTVTVEPPQNMASLPSARFPQAQVLVGSLFSVADLSQAICSISIRHRLSVVQMVQDAYERIRTYCIEARAACRRSKLPPLHTRTRRCYVRSKSCWVVGWLLMVVEGKLRSSLESQRSGMQS